MNDLIKADVLLNEPIHQNFRHLKVFNIQLH